MDVREEEQSSAKVSKTIVRPMFKVCLARCFVLRLPATSTSLFVESGIISISGVVYVAVFVQGLPVDLTKPLVSIFSS